MEERKAAPIDGDEREAGQGQGREQDGDGDGDGDGNEKDKSKSTIDPNDPFSLKFQSKIGGKYC